MGRSQVADGHAAPSRLWAQREGLGGFSIFAPLHRASSGYGRLGSATRLRRFAGQASLRPAHSPELSD